MENLLLPSLLLSDLIGISEQSFSRQENDLPVEDSNIFFGILSQKMTSAGNHAAQSQEIMRMVNETAMKLDNYSLAWQEATGAGLTALQWRYASSCAGEDMPDTLYIEQNQDIFNPDRPQQQNKTGLAQLASGVIFLLMMPEMSGKSENVTRIEEFLCHVIEVLSDGDEIEFTRDMTVQRGPDDGNSVDRTSHPFTLESPIPVFAASHLTSAPRETTGAIPEHNKNIPGLAGKADYSEMSSPNLFGFPADREGQKDMYTVNVEIAKPAGRTAIPEKPAIQDMRIIESRMLYDPPAAEIVQSEKTADPQRMNARIDLKEDNLWNADKIVIRIKETEDTQIDRNKPDHKNESQLIVYSDDARPEGDRNNPETRGVAKNDFRALMADKIEKLSQTFAGKSMNIDMHVKLKVGENETILVSLRDDGSKVHVDIRGTDENTLNYLQQQKDNLIKNLETRNITTAIYVDIDQDARQRQQQKNRDRAKDADGEDDRDFQAFFEAMA